eukprot:TRINITY_DN42175_c0_g1_i1.p1 TRINITY_DN42175_c0_g1~~TRINITY_DN42175_c0_g1_i1.p1  ORF type:complete len:538 (+),score=52.39 TRINITY_DN42175_c0_g1_i1:69-1616(+)
MDAPAAGSDGPVYDRETGLSVPEIAVWMVFLTIFLDTMAATISTPVLPFYAREFGASNADLGYLFAAWSFTSTFCAPFLGRLSDRIGRRPVLVLSLLGAGLANVGQASATSYWMLFVWRAFSGVWAAVNSSAQVYLADVCSPLVLPDYMAKLGAVPGAAMTFGPGFGGGLAKFGLCIPILVDGVISLAAAALVFIYLPESPIWLAAGSKQHQHVQQTNKTGSTSWAIHVLGFSSFLWGFVFGTRVSMQVVSLNAKLDWDALHIGYLYTALALLMLCQNFWITPRLQKWCGVVSLAVIGTLAQGLLTVFAFAIAESTWLCISCLLLANVGFGTRNATSGTITARFTDQTNRGRIFAQVQMWTNFGRMVGPIVSGNLAVRDPIVLPWLASGLCTVLSALLLLMVRVPSTEAAPPPQTPLLHGMNEFTDLRDVSSSLEQEVGSQEDYDRLGRHVGELLTRRNYRWVSKQKSTFKMLDRLLPELREIGKEQLEDLETIIRHARDSQRDLEKLAGRTTVS